MGIRNCTLDCEKCPYQTCIDGTQKETKKKDRTEYYKQYHQEHYNAQTQYVRWVEVRKMINKHKKEIGTINYQLLMDELNTLEKTKYH